MATLSGVWTSRNGRDLGDGGVIKRSGIDTNDLIRIDPTGIIYYDANNSWSIDSDDKVIGSLIYYGPLAKTSGVFSQDKFTPTSFNFGANKADERKGLLVIFDQKFLSGATLDPPPPVVPSKVKVSPEALKNQAVSVLTNRSKIDDFLKNNLEPSSILESTKSVDLSSDSTSNGIQNIILTGSNVANLSGNSSDNTLKGNSSANVLDGEAGNDIMLGGGGDDSYFVDSIFDTIIELADEGVDTVNSYISFVLPENFENLTLIDKAQSATGNGNNNILLGNTYKNSLYGLAGDDLLDGQGGGDSLFGGTGDDTYRIYTLSDKAYELAREGRDKVVLYIEQSIHYDIPSNIEGATLDAKARCAINGNNLSNEIFGNSVSNLIKGGSGDDFISGLGGDDNLYGDAGNDYIDGGEGSDITYGGAGNDYFIVDNINDIVVEFSGQGEDLIQSSDSFVLPSNVEKLVLSGVNNISGSGNSANNTITGNSGNNTIDGGAGVDILTGQGGSDTFCFFNRQRFGASTSDRITDFSSNDNIMISKSSFGISANSFTTSSVFGSSALTASLATNALFVYDINSGFIYWNQNGSMSGVGAGGIFGVLENKFPGLVTSNFILTN